MSAAREDTSQASSGDSERSHPLSPSSSAASHSAVEHGDVEMTIEEDVRKESDSTTDSKTSSKRWPTPPLDRVWAVDTFKGKSNRASMERMLVKAGKDPNAPRFRNMTAMELQLYGHNLQKKTVGAQYGATVAHSSDDEVMEEPSVSNVAAKGQAVLSSGNMVDAEAIITSPRARKVDADADADFEEALGFEDSDSEVDQEGLTRASAALKSIKRAVIYDSTHHRIDLSDDVDSEPGESDEDAEGDVQSTYTWKTILYAREDEPVMSYKVQLVIREIISLRKKLQDPPTDEDFRRNIEAGITVPKFKRKCNVVVNEVAKMIGGSDSKFQAKVLVNKILIGSFKAGKL
ncbi:hypothetical protein K491DRAFT_711189 [Lophiostoma macrostomum CBS 122681]|uniref:Uncharacterized protein n=1 Tax=Lophiostoma macrostomum CBS 122681 TaxID=1314788 RepID=A0A6A6TLK9_9PLEO|nr:hypothetical protein K491DRAFT_711189 [Lophiostoma macrostomum CBS 122681]